MVSGPVHATDTWPLGRKNVRESSEGVVTVVVVVVAGRAVVVVVEEGTTVVEVVPPGLASVVATGAVVDVVEGASGALVDVGGSLGGTVIGPTDDWPPMATGIWTGISTARSATRPTAWEATPTASAVASNQAAGRPNRFFISFGLSIREG